MSAHTPGPWSYRHVAKPVRHWEVEIPGDHPIAIGRSGGPDDTHDRDGANAALISSAPDLLAACERILGTSACGECVEQGRAPCVYCQVRAAIAKARGES